MSLFGKKKKFKETVLSDTGLFCDRFKKLIHEEDCVHYEHNRRCDTTKDYLKRTHPSYPAKGIGGSIVRGTGGLSPLWVCDYCRERNEEGVKEGYVPEELRKYFPLE